METHIKPYNDNEKITLLGTALCLSLETIKGGTSKFLQDFKENKFGPDNNLIGQFGVGFNTTSVIADKIAVLTKSPKSDKQHVWEGNHQLTRVWVLKFIHCSRYVFPPLERPSAYFGG